MASSSVFMALCVSTSSLWFGYAGTFLQSGPRDLAETVRNEEVAAALSSELAEALGGGLAEKKFTHIEEALRPMYSTLPKNEHGNIGRSVVRYALHRFFVKKHGWFVKGLDAAEGGHNASSPTGILTGRVPGYIEDLFEQHLSGRGFGLRQLAVLVATLEHLVHDETIGRLQASYQAHKVLPTDLVTENEAKGIIEAYMASLLLGFNLATLTQSQLERLKKQVAPKAYPGWNDTQLWLQDMQLSVAFDDRGANNPFVSGELSFPRIAHVVEEVGDMYGRFQDLECRSLKEGLMDRERQLPGRVLLSDFYRKGLDGKFMFTESVEYLRQLGALDESDPQMPSVVVPNYINAKSNCLGRSNFYMICCIDECESLLGNIESEIAAPNAEPHRIAALVASMPSDTMDAPRNLSSALLDRLNEIAQNHGGRVPLHGRLFSQWLHHAYPNECPYPQLANETDLQLSSPLKKVMSKKDMHNYVEGLGEDEIDKLVEGYDLPWMPVESLLTDYEPLPSGSQQNWFWPMFRNLGLAVALLSGVLSLAQTAKSAFSCFDSSKSEKYYV